MITEIKGNLAPLCFYPTMGGHFTKGCGFGESQCIPKFNQSCAEQSH